MMTESESESCSCCSSDLLFYDESSDTSSNHMGVAGCYMNEPEYSDVELGSEGESSVSGSSGDSDALDSSRLENLHWCTCYKCVIFESFKIVECKCCQEYSTLLNDKLANVKCITDHEDFQLLCLNQRVLENSAIRYRRSRRKIKNT